MMVFRVIWTLQAGTLHSSAPRFLSREAAERVRQLVLTDPAVTSANVVPVQVRPVALAVPEPVPCRRPAA